LVDPGLPIQKLQTKDTADFGLLVEIYGHSDV